ncbi:MAG: acyltransferase [Saprospiraceae bacterium]|nr:acyltransferase [Saprospiraceae bacterium]
MGLSAFAVISVILFHLGYLVNGYLGVDIFFVISGYLITGIVYDEVERNNFSVLKFYERRIRRIIPLVLFTTLITFVLGIIFMLPDDLENLCQSIVATNFSANNILMYITSSDYWAVKNDYKPLMHTWSLGVEEQFYLLYPVIFYILKGNKKKYILPTLVILTIFSLTFFLTSNNIASKFYFLQYRFFELSIGGICAIYFNNKNLFTTFSKSQYILFLLILSLIYLLYFNSTNSIDFKVLIATLLTSGVLIIGNLHFEQNGWYRFLISNSILRGIGKISFSLYMWHQIVFAFSRYFLVEEITLGYSILLSIIIILLSIMSYFLIENPFRNRAKIKTKPLLLIVILSFILITCSSLYVYFIGGIIKDVPELGITKSNRTTQLNFFSGQNNINIQYNENVSTMNNSFTNNDKIKILVVGDSYARDFANIILESSFKENVEISYMYLPKPEFRDRFIKADFIFYATDVPSTKEIIRKRMKDIELDTNKLWIVGTKDFGNSNGFFYNRKNKENDFNCQAYRVQMKKGILKINEKLKNEWGDRYIDLIGLIIDSNSKVLVFTPDCMFISQDTLHLTKFGAVFFSKILDSKLRMIMKLT